MRTKRQATIDDLRRVIDRLPTATKVAMLAGIRANPIIVGAYSNRDGICPMLAAHRAGGRTSVIAFSKAWDRFAMRGTGERKARRATERELLILSSHLEASLLAEAAPHSAMAAAIDEHRELIASRRRRRRQRAGDRDRSGELRLRPGWSWTPVVRRVEDYERALQAVEERARRESGRPVPETALS